jgi:hypothetical protein
VGDPVRMKKALDKAGFVCDYIEHSFTAHAIPTGQVRLGGVVILIGTNPQ